MSDTTITTDYAETVTIRTKEHSYGIFCYNSKGDLFLSSDWGMYGYAWRSWGAGSFESFLKQVNPEYVFEKFDGNTRYLFKGGLPKHVRPHVEALVKELISYLNSRK